MCGFLVEYSPQGNYALDRNTFLALLDKSKVRGPDSSGYFSNGNNLQMGFNRLAILELSTAGEQPMKSHNDRYNVVFNGEIYNHLELREKLRFKKFKGLSDTETITSCLVEWGIINTVNALNGMFSLVIFDNLEKELYLIRDFAGIKPLFYGWDGKTLVAASQYDQIFSHPQYRSKAIEPQVLKLYLEQHYMPFPFGLYSDTFQVAPGEIICIKKNGTLAKMRYWELPTAVEYSIASKRNAQKCILENLSKSIANQLRSDVPVGAFLSGGVDSTLVASFIGENNGKPKVFTIGSDSTVHDESQRASQFAEAMALQQEIWQLSAHEVLQYWDEAMLSLHEPLGDFSILPTYLVSRLAKKNVGVSLSGDGGDELFFGYERFWSVGKNIGYQHYPSLFRKAVYGFDKYTTGNKRVNSVLLASAQAKAHQGLHSRFRSSWLNQIAPQLATVSLPENYGVYKYANTRDSRQLLYNMRHSEFYGMMQKTLRKVDLASMQNSLEVRVPFLDKNVVEAALKIDPMLSYGKGKRKQLLKDLLSKRFPSIGQETEKKGFSIPLSGWLRQDLKEKVVSRLMDSDMAPFGFERRAIEKMIQLHLEKKEDLKWPIFTLYALTQFR